MSRVEGAWVRDEGSPWHIGRLICWLGHKFKAAEDQYWLKHGPANPMKQSWQLFRYAQYYRLYAVKASVLANDQIPEAARGKNDWKISSFLISWQKH